MSDEVLAISVQLQDLSAFKLLYDRHCRLVYALTLRILGETTATEDVLQDVFLTLWRNAQLFDASRGSFLVWFLAVARHRALDHLRLRRERLRRCECDLDDLPDLPCFTSHPQPEASIDASRLAARARASVNVLSPQQRRAIEMAYFEGLTHTEIALELRQPLGTVKSWIRVGLKKLRIAIVRG